VTLDPAFSSSVTNYTATVPFGSSSVDVSATTSDGNAGFTINGSNDTTVALAIGDNTISIVVTAENGTTTRTYTVVVTRPNSPAANMAQEAYIKASNTDCCGAPFTTGDRFGRSVALSADGNTLAVGALQEDSAATGVNGDQADNSAPIAGAVYIFTFDSTGGWTQQAYVKASNTGEGDLFGQIVALSGDGNTLAVGARHEDSAATGANGVQTDDSKNNAGAVYVYTRDSADVWTQQAYVKANNTDADDLFGNTVALSGDGNSMAVGAHFEGSAATGVNSDHTDNSATGAGAIYVFTRDSAGIWTQQAYVKASNADAGDFFGWTVALSSDGNTLAAGAHLEDSAATGANGVQTDNSTGNAGAAYVFTRDNAGVWTQQAYVKASNTGSGDHFGLDLALSGDGNTLAVSAQLEDSAATGIDGAQGDDSAANAGAVYVFARDSANVWTQQAYVKASNTDAIDHFGKSVVLADEGNTMAMGARAEDSAATGVHGDQLDNSAVAAGAVYVLTRDSTGGWEQQAYVKASNADADDFFGVGVALSGDGNLLVIGAEGESSAAAGVDGDQIDNSSSDAGAVYVFR